MAKRSVALARSSRPVPNSKLQPRHARRSPPASISSLERTAGSAWNELEQAFFDAAPPDEVETGAEPERFDDLDAAAPARGGAGRALSPAWAAIRRLFGRADRGRQA
jgi:hypothetical protein